MLPIEVVCEITEFFSLKTCCRLSPSCFKLHQVVQKRIDAKRKEMERKRNKLLSCIEERWRDSIDELRCFSVLASSMKAATTASWLGGHYCWTLDAGGTALLAQAMSVPGRQVSQKHIKDYLEAGVKNFDWLGELQKVYTFYPSKIVKPFAIAFLKATTGLNSSIMVHIARCLLGDPELMAAQDICHWMSDDDFDLCFKVGDNFDVLKPVPANLHVNRSAAVQALDQLSTAPGSRILSHGQNVYEIFID